MTTRKLSTVTPKHSPCRLRTASVLLLATLFAMLFAFAGCRANVVPDAIATAVPTVTPDPTPTPEPTLTPVPTPTPLPEGWIVDPRGIIPPEVEILVPETTDNFSPWVFCIARNDAGEIVLQKWQGGLQAELSFPELEMFLQKKSIYAYYDFGELLLQGYDTEAFHPDYPYLYYYEVGGYYFCLEVTLASQEGNTVMIATTDGKAIMWEIGEPTYLLHDFGEENIVELGSNGNFRVNGSAVWDIEWEEYPMKVR